MHPHYAHASTFTSFALALFALLLPCMPLIFTTPLLAAAANIAPAASTATAAGETQTRPLADILDDIKTRFSITLKIPDKTLLENKNLPWADARIRRYSAADSLRNALSPFDLMFTVENDGSYRIIAYDHPRRTPAEGDREIEYLTKHYNEKSIWEEQTSALRPALLRALQLSPLPARPDSQPILTPVRHLQGYSAQNFALETLPGVYICGTLYIPENAPAISAANVSTAPVAAKHPLIVAPNGHFPDGRYHHDQQILCATLARMGAYAISYDLFSYGESLLQFDAASHRTPMAQTMQILNGLRIIDWFSRMPGIDSARIAVTGASSGGSQAMMLAALDSRVCASAPVVMVSAHFDGGCPCESGRPVHTAAGGMNNCELAALAAPRPQLIVSDGHDWTFNVPVREYPFIKHIYGLLGAADRVTNAHLPVEGHDYGPSKRAAVYRFFAAQLDLNLAAATENPNTMVEPNATLYALGDNGEKLPTNAIKGMPDLQKLFQTATGN